ncbi:furin-like protease 2 isoform X1 [Macrobrachium nipponense]|uniref:furin-like protease 2 isoform X1 n=1 Tax=Macrobrachium nipponense TaxID=159736 RepID=UPI0030C8BA8B
MTRTNLLKFVALLATLISTIGASEDRETRSTNPGDVFHNQFAVHIPEGANAAQEIASTHGFSNLGQIGSLENYYLFEHPHVHKRSAEPSDHHHETLSSDPRVMWVEQQKEKKRVKRDGSMVPDDPSPHVEGERLLEDRDVLARQRRQFDFSRFFFTPTPSRRGSSRFPDPLYSRQWYLSEGANGGYDMNVGPAWARGYTGKGVVVTILDDGIQHNHPDIAQNYDPKASTDINDSDPDPMPRDNGDNRHGTRCAGEVAAVAFNDYCGVGVAYNSSVGGVRMLDGTVNDAVEARAISLNPDHIDIYSASWGPEDDGKTVDGPGPLAKRAFINGVIRGRHGKGSIFVWASGNGGRHTDNCNCDGYTNSIFTLSISSASQRGYKPWYLEECSSTLATTYSSGTPGVDASVATVDMDGDLRAEHICTIEHTGTSASAPLAAGICALALEANPDLTWRDMQHIVVMTSRYEPLRQEDGWFTNGVGRRVSHKFGYGLMDAGKLVELAEKWTTVPPQHVCQSSKDRTQKGIPTIMGESVVAEIVTDGCAGTSAEVRYLEHVQARVSLRFLPRGNINIKLVSPSGTVSTLLFDRPRDVFSEKFDDWPFLSVHFWGEKAAGTWKLIVTNAGTRQVPRPGVLIQWQLILHGTREPPGRLRSEQSQRSDPLSSLTLVLPTQSASAPHIPSRRPSSDPFTFSVLDQIFAGSSPEATFATPDGTIISGPNQIASAVSNGTKKVSESEVCHSQCRGGCSGPGPNNCRGCHHYSLEGECVGSCPEGTYASENQECLGCHESCVMCSGPAQNQCLACHSGLLYVLHLGLCVETCPQGYYSVDGTCMHCGLHCNECDGPEQCTICDHHLLLANGSCLTSCPQGFYETQDNKCGSCYPQCETCVGGSENDCATCRPNSYQYKGRCVFRCPDGTFGEEVTGECLVCPAGCATCNGADSCTTCIDGWRIKSGRCVASSNHCNMNEFAGVDGLCQPCHSTCLACVGPRDSECLHCAQRRFLLESKCVGSCPHGYFALRGRCLPCPHGCHTCTSYKECGSCSAKFHLYNSQCIASCPLGFYSDRGICVACESSCFSCYGPRSDQCASCHNSSFLLNSTCRPSCPDSHYPDGRKCLPCYNNCRTCKGSGLNDCTSCHDYLTLDGGMCIECRSGRYYNLSSQSCESCHSSCLTCSSGGDGGCTSCEAPKSLHLESGTCRMCCPEGVTEEDHGPPCCSCDPATSQCFGAVSADKRRIALSLNSDSSQTPYRQPDFLSATSLIVIICLVNVLMFGAVFTVLQVRSNGSLCWSRDYSYRFLKTANMSEKVSLTLVPFVEEDDSEDEREHEQLYMKA